MRTHHIPLILALIAIVPLLATSGKACADNYMRSEGESYYSASLEGDTAHDRWNQQDKLEPLPCTARNWKLTQNYEYGLSYYNTFFGSLEYVNRKCGIYDASGIGNLTFGIRRRIDIYRNGRSWEAEAIIPTGYSTTAKTTIGSGLYGLRLGLFGAFGENSLSNGDIISPLEMGANIYIWEGAASEQFAGYIKTNFLATNLSHFYATVEGDYALIDRSKNLNTTINSVSNYGYDRLNARLGFSSKISLNWRIAIEGTNVLRGRNTNDSNSIKLVVSRNFLD